MKKLLNKNLILILSLTLLLIFSVGCSATIDDVTYEGINVVWVPIIRLWNWLWKTFTPIFWENIMDLWSFLPKSISWLPGIITIILGAVVYIVISVVIIIIDLILLAIVTVIWVIGWVVMSTFKAIFS